MTQTKAWESTIAGAGAAIDVLDQAIIDLNKYRDAATAEIAKYLQMDKGIELDLDAIRATATRPYTILPIGEHEAWLIHWRGVKMPIFGWVVAQEPAFIKAKVTRSMDLLTPLPGWMKQELGWKPPAHAAIIDGTHTSLRLTDGDADTFKRRYGQNIGAKQADGTYKIRGGDAWIKLVAALIKDGILPYAPTPVAPENWNAKAKTTAELMAVLEKLEWKTKRPFIQRTVDEFRTKGAVLSNLPPGAGKTLATCLVLTHFVGKVLLLGDTTTLVEQWLDRLKKFAPNANVTVSTYQGAAKYLQQEWDLLIPDEAQRLPANTFSKLAFIKTKYRLGLTGTAWREDDRQHLIIALSGFPISVRWAELIEAGVLRKPRILVATVISETAKTAYVRSLVEKRKGRTLIFCDWLEQGQALADALDVPFIQGSTARKLQKIEENEVCVVSRVGDRGISFPDVRLVIEVAGAGSAREQFAQRVGRLLHGDFEGQFVTVFTPEEATKYRGRIFGVEAELAGEVDIEFVTIGNVAETPERAQRSRTRTAAPARRSISAPSPARSDPRPQPQDEIAIALSMPAIAAKLGQARKSVGGRTAPYVERVMRYCWSAALSPKEIAEGLGITDVATQSRLSSACKASAEVGLMVVDDQKRYRVNKDEIGRLRALSELRRR